MKRYPPLLLALMVLAGCTGGGSPAATATPYIFPTVTIGARVNGVLNPDDIPLFDDSFVANPATAVAIVSEPSPTPENATCPPLTDNAALAGLPESTDEAAAEIARFLSAGGDPAALADGLREDWDALGESGFVRADLDLTGDAQAEVIVSLSLPGEGGTLLILSCLNRQYVARYQSVSDEPIAPELLLLGDMNRDDRTDLMFATRQCVPADPDDPDSTQICRYQAGLVSWLPEEGRFVSLLGVTVASDGLPIIQDVDNDAVNEIVARVEDDGNAETGPLRTGVNIFDWNGTVYVLSIVQPDPPAYRIQVIHEADRYFAGRDMATAILLYQQALTDPDLRAWRNDETIALESYTLYRLLVAQVFSSSADVLTTAQSISDRYPAQEPATVYVAMARAFWDTFQTTDSTATACAQVLSIVAAQPDALDLINRYGSRSPTYGAQDLCPF